MNLHTESTDQRTNSDRLSRSTTGESAELSTGPVDILLATSLVTEHAEAMRQEVVARLVAERYSFPIWFSPPRPNMNDTETIRAHRRRLMAADFDTFGDTIEAIA